MTSKQRGLQFEAVVKKLIEKLESVKAELQLTRIEGKQKIRGKSGANYEIDVIAYDSRNGKPVLIECKHWANKRRIPRDAILAFVYKIRDVGGERGYIVVSTGLQKGAREVAETENIEIITLNYDATAEKFDLVLQDRGKHYTGMYGMGQFQEEITFQRVGKKKPDGEWMP